MAISPVIGERLRRVGLTAPRWRTPVEVVGHLLAVQAQDYEPALWSIGQRLSPPTGRDAVHAAVAAGQLVRTHVLRPTWHLVAPDDLRWLLALTGPRVQRANATYYARFGLDAAALARCARVLVAELTGGVARTRAELLPALAGAGLPTAGLPLAYALMSAELDAVICSGPPAGRHQTYALVDERVPAGTAPADAVAELVLRYLAGHGPATTKDLRSWSSLTLGQLGSGIEAAGDLLRRDEVDGLTFWSRADGDGPAAAGPVAHLIHGYDEYLVGYTESKPLVDVAGDGAAAYAAGELLNGILLVHGQLAGSWRRTLRARTVGIEVRVLRPLDDDTERAVRAACDAHADFLGLTADVVLR